MVKKLRAIVRHAINNIGDKTLDAQPKNEKLPTKHLIQKHKIKIIAKTCACATKNIFKIRMKKTSSIGDHGKNVTIAKNIMNYV